MAPVEGDGLFATLLCMHKPFILFLSTNGMYIAEQSLHIAYLVFTPVVTFR